jgi:Mrp family chromosome partitioning ATPase
VSRIRRKQNGPGTALAVADEFASGPFADITPELVDALRYLVNSRELAGGQPLPRQVALTSSMRGEGVTTVSQAMAIILAEDHEALVCWVDLSGAGSSKPAAAATDDDDEQATAPGVSDVLRGDVELATALTLSNESQVVVLGAGSMTGSGRSGSYRSSDLDALVATLGTQFDHIVFDMPPVLESSAALPLFRFAEAYYFVIRSGVTRRDPVRRATRQLSEIPLLGTVLNRQRTKVPRFLQRLGSD